MGDGEIYDSMLRHGLNDALSNQHSGRMSEDLVARRHIPRVARDRCEYRSQTDYCAAQAGRKFEREIVTIETPSGEGPVAFGRDESSGFALKKLQRAFCKDGTITDRNASGLNCGAAAMVDAGSSRTESRGVEPMARLVSFGMGAVEQGMFSLGPLRAMRQALEWAPWNKSFIDRVELNEAFASVMALIMELGFPENIVNVEGVAVAHGHPIGATGAILATRLTHSMHRDNVRGGFVTICNGGRQGIAPIMEKT
jgi:acetyl-CoA C-acetyltransferase